MTEARVRQLTGVALKGDRGLSDGVGLKGGGLEEVRLGVIDRAGDGA